MLGVALGAPPDPSAVRAAIDSAFRSAAFRRPLGQAAWDRFLDWLRAAAEALRGGPAKSPALFWLVTAAAIVVVAFALGRGAVAWDDRVRRGGAARGGARRDDAWRAADAAAAEGRLLDAAHLLYAGVVDALARSAFVRPHRSKTVGDYARELRVLRDPRAGGAAAAYREFGRQYETFVYAAGAADVGRWVALRGRADAVRATVTGGARAMNAP